MDGWGDGLLEHSHNEKQNDERRKDEKDLRNDRFNRWNETI